MSIPFSAEVSIFRVAGTCGKVAPFDLDVYDLALESSEEPLYGDPLGAFDLQAARGWLVRPN